MGKKMSNILQHADHKSFDLPRLREAEATQQAIEHSDRTRAKPGQRLETRFGQLQLHQPSILRTATPVDQTFCFEPVDHAGHRTGVIREVLAKLRRRIDTALGQYTDNGVLSSADLKRREVRV